MYRKLVGNHSDLYSSRLIKLPTPQFVIFYNGTKVEPERRVLRLSDAFTIQDGSLAPSLECTAIMLNINAGNNARILGKCRKLDEYAQFISLVREHLKMGCGVEKAVDRAVDVCIENGILATILNNNRQEVRDMILTEYNEELHLRMEREIALEEGESIGLAKGEALKLISLVRKKIAKSMQVAEIAEMLEEDESVIECIYHILMQHPEWENGQIYEEWKRE